MNKYQGILIDINKFEDNTNTFGFCRKYLRLIKNNKGYYHFGDFIKQLDKEELEQVSEGINFIVNNVENVYSRSVMSLVYIAALGEGCPSMDKEDCHEAIINLTKLILAHNLCIANEGLAIYENFKITGLHTWDVIFVPYDKNKSEKPEEQPKDPTIQSGT